MKINSIAVTIIGALLVLNMAGVGALGTPTTGIAGWIIELVVLAMGIRDIVKAYK